jgi:hypothetical protein
MGSAVVLRALIIGGVSEGVIVLNKIRGVCCAFFISQERRCKMKKVRAFIENARSPC